MTSNQSKVEQPLQSLLVFEACFEGFALKSKLKAQFTDICCQPSLKAYPSSPTKKKCTFFLVGSAIHET